MTVLFHFVHAVTTGYNITNKESSLWIVTLYVVVTSGVMKKDMLERLKSFKNVSDRI